MHRLWNRWETRHGTGEPYKEGFTLVEIMVVVAIIGLLAAMAIPAFNICRKNSQNTRFISDLRIATHAVEQYCIENRGYPEDRTPGVLPPGMASYLEGMQWTQPTPIGGRWDWDYLQFSCKAGVSVYFGNIANDARMTEIDNKIDDGNLTTGVFRKRAQGYIYIIEF